MTPALFGQQVTFELSVLEIAVFLVCGNAVKAGKDRKIAGLTDVGESTILLNGKAPDPTGTRVQCVDVLPVCTYCDVQVCSACRILADDRSLEWSQSAVRADCKSRDGGTSCVGDIHLRTIGCYDVPAVCRAQGRDALTDRSKLTSGEN
jgi:hypothetical protein